MIGTILLVFAFVFAVIATLGISIPRVHFGWLSIAFYFLSILLGGAHALSRVGEYASSLIG